jgi:hypothetical protein
LCQLLQEFRPWLHEVLGDDCPWLRHLLLAGGCAHSSVCCVDVAASCPVLSCHVLCGYVCAVLLQPLLMSHLGRLLAFLLLWGMFPFILCACQLAYFGAAYLLRERENTPAAAPTARRAAPTVQFMHCRVALAPQCTIQHLAVHNSRASHQRMQSKRYGTDVLYGGGCRPSSNCCINEINHQWTASAHAVAFLACSSHGR